MIKRYFTVRGGGALYRGSFFSYNAQKVTLVWKLFMAMKLRLARHGKKRVPFYWIMAADAREPRETGKEKLGTYDPCLSQGTRPKIILEEARVQYWLSCGAQPTDRVRRILVEANILPPMLFSVTPKKSAPRKKALERQQRAQAVAAAAASEKVGE